MSNSILDEYEAKLVDAVSLPRKQREAFEAKHHVRLVVESSGKVFLLGRRGPAWDEPIDAAMVGL